MNTATNHKKSVRPLHVDETASPEEQIARRAYELWQQRERAGREGSDLGDWFQAEREIAERHEKPVPARTPRRLGGQ